MLVRTMFVVTCVVGCNGKGDDSNGGGGSDDSNPNAEDADKDGFPVGEDCNDGNAAINPEAAEICDTVDNDCDGTTDVGAADAVEYWVDADLDGYGAGKATASCTAITGSVANDDDCDDSRADVSPDGVEICDAADADEDCDALIDDDDDSLDPKSATMTLYPDVDLDAYGDATAPFAACAEHAGYVVDGTDCDDANLAVNPLATEVCGDGLDNNCDTMGCGWSGAWEATDSNANVVGETDYMNLGNDVVPAGDIDGNGVVDLLIGSSYNGTAFLMAGPVSGSLASTDALAAFTSPASGDYNGSENFGLGDQDGDGYDDLLVAAYNYNSSAGRVYVVLGPVTGTHTTDTVADATIDGDACIGCYPPVDFGWQPSAGDVNGDGVIDIMAAAPGGFTDGSGGVYFYFGPVTTGTLTTGDADVAIAGVANNDWTGGANAADGDVDGDGIDDALISAEQTDYAYTDDGVAYLFYGPISGVTSVTEADVMFHGATDNTHLGWIAAMNGDVSGDGVDDLAISAPYTLGGVEGDVWLFYADVLSTGSDFDVAKANAQLTGEDIGDQFGANMDIGGDLNTDDFADLAVGAPTHGGGDGAVYLFNGPVSGAIAATTADLTITATGPQALGSAIMFVGDTSEDGYDDLAVGSSGANAGGSSRGAVGLWFGGGL
jgi:hypothetical protein